MHGEHQPTPEELLIAELRKQIVSLEKQLVEYNSLKVSEKRANEEVLKLQELVR
jgi:hypothetical protein